MTYTCTSPAEKNMVFKADLAKNTPKLFMTDYDRGRPLDYETEWCPAGIIERFEKIKMASKMATHKKSGP